MALKKCKECGNEVSTEAQSCPKCGAVLKKKTGCLGYIGAGFLILVILGVIGSLMNDNSNKSTSPRQTQKPPVAPTVTPKPPATPLKPEEKREWEKVASFGMTTTVYMSPSALSDKHHIAQVLHTLRSRAPVQQIWFYDSKSKTPTGVPMTDDQMLHWRARYSVNRNTGHEEFVFITVTDATTSPPEISETKADIRPGYAE